ncbi:MAG: serine/threonine protein kinase [Verrucomicrobiales bacterium]|nr:serine/threonine protein kinase [Verrucomicrobiales bacterium]
MSLPLPEGDSRIITYCPECNEAVDVTELAPFTKVMCPHCEATSRVKTQLGNFQIVKLLGEGGMSQVFLANDLALNRQVALKVLHQSLNLDSALTAMFEREATLTASINHPNVVRVYTASTDQGYFYIAMELVDNVSIEQMILVQGNLREPRVIDIAHDVTLGLKAAHQAGLIHRDIKPGNMLVTTDGIAKLVDFGLALHQDGEDDVQDLWATPFYVPPEKLDGKPDTFQGDIYSLGATFFHALAGKPPFEANTSSLEELKQIKARPINFKESLPHISKPTLELIERMMAYDPANRHGSYDELQAEVEQVLEKVPGTTKGRGGRRANGVGKMELSRTAKVGLWIGAGVLGLAATIGIILAIVGNAGNNTLIGEERVIEAGSETISAKFLEGRDAMVNNDFAAARSAFLELTGNHDLNQPTLGWVQFNRGLMYLMDGDEKSARLEFDQLRQAAGFADELKPEVVAQKAFFQQIGAVCSEMLPVKYADADQFPEGTPREIGLFACALKNWNQQQFGAARTMFEKFSASTAPAGYKWFSEFNDEARNYVADANKLDSLPAPDGGMTDSELRSLKTDLQAALTTFQTRGTIRRFVQARARRCDEIIEFRDEAKRIAKVMAGNFDAAGKGTMTNTGNPPAMVPNPPNPNPPNPNPPIIGQGGMSAKETGELETLSKLIADTSNLAQSYHFSAAALKLEAGNFETSRVTQLHRDAVQIFQEADAFVDRFATEMNKGTYEGNVRRKQGKVLEAKITAADREKLVVNLIFGDNDVEMEHFACDWVLEAAEEIFLRPDVISAASESAVWKQGASFAAAAGLPEQADRIAKQATPVDSSFGDAWGRLAEARLFGLTPPPQPPPEEADSN